MTATKPASGFDKFLKTFFALSPTAIATYLSHWQGLLGDAGLAHRDFQPQVERLALGVSTLGVLASYLWLHNASRKVLRRAFTVVVGVYIASLVLCFVASIWLGSLTTKASIQGTIHLWKWFYFTLLLSESVSVVLFMLWLLAPRQDTPSSASDGSMR